MSLAGHTAGSLRFMGEARICQLTFSTMTTRCSFMEQADRMRLSQIPLCIILVRHLPVHNDLLVNILVKAWIYSLIRTSTELLCDILIVVLQDSHLPACLAACLPVCLSGSGLSFSSCLFSPGQLIFYLQENMIQGNVTNIYLSLKWYILVHSPRFNYISAYSCAKAKLHEGNLTTS